MLIDRFLQWWIIKAPHPPFYNYVPRCRWCFFCSSLSLGSLWRNGQLPRNKLSLHRKDTDFSLQNKTLKVQVHDQIFFAKDCMPCNRLCRNCSCYWSIFSSVSVLEYRFTVIIPQKSVNKDCKACEMWHRNFARGNAA